MTEVFPPLGALFLLQIEQQRDVYAMVIGIDDSGRVITLVNDTSRPVITFWYFIAAIPVSLQTATMTVPQREEPTGQTRLSQRCSSFDMP